MLSVRTEGAAVTADSARRDLALRKAVVRSMMNPRKATHPAKNIRPMACGQFFVTLPADLARDPAKVKTPLASVPG
jgi:hypothetical protein